VSSLQESKIECIVKDKVCGHLDLQCASNSYSQDAYLYYFLLRYPGRSLVFLGSIDGIRRIVPILQHLQVNVIPLHSQLEQKQRMRNLEKLANRNVLAPQPDPVCRFRDSSHAVLIATDIAARGLDIPSVHHVIHYQVPRSADVYVHRSGRTARAKAAGFSLLLIGPDERKTIRLLLSSLGRQRESSGFFVLLTDEVSLSGRYP
jgi:ATP-dependent RNA helicase DDX24/MAK5